MIGRGFLLPVTVAPGEPETAAGLGRGRASCQRRQGRTIGVRLERRVRRALERGPFRLALLLRVRDLVRGDRVALEGSGPVFAFTERDVTTEGDRPRALVAREGGGLRVVVNPDLRKVCAEPRRESREQTRVERLAGTEAGPFRVSVGADPALRRSPRRLRSIGSTEERGHVGGL